MDCWAGVMRWGRARATGSGPRVGGGGRGVGTRAWGLAVSGWDGEAAGGDELPSSGGDSTNIPSPNLGADHAAGDLTGDGDHGDRVKEGIDKAENQVSDARAGGGDADIEVAGGAGVAGGGEDLTLLVVEEVVDDGGRVGEGLVDLHRDAIEVGKDVGDALVLEGFNKDVCILAGLIGEEATERGGGTVEGVEC
uniref:Uncharacterized protein LOC105061421 n=1 Tax=Elaeis guineensis var. tenera TaxID=51953 RepID=A0A6I9SI91_ELAGV|nr:uncharacterized protein LOC105061421 [Elaeis guineensis]